MKIINIQTNQNCNNQFQKKIIFFKNDITKEDVIVFAKNRCLILNENFYIPHFKIIDNDFIIRGSINTNRITIDFNTEDKQKCDLLLNEFIKHIENKAGYNW